MRIMRGASHDPRLETVLNGPFILDIEPLTYRTNLTRSHTLSDASTGGS